MRTLPLASYELLRLRRMITRTYHAIDTYAGAHFGCLFTLIRSDITLQALLLTLACTPML